jgi:hypothetical protein
MRRIGYLTLLMVLSFSVSCTFENDMSYPHLQGQILAFAVEGQKSVTIDPESQTVDVILQETAKIDALKVLEFDISEKTTTDFVPGELIDMSEPVDVLLNTYPGQEYLWTISASQPIDRYVRCSGMIDAVFDAKNLKVLVSVIENQPLEDIVFEAIKLGPETSKIISTTGHDGSTSGSVTRAVDFPMTLDCTLDRKFTVLYDGVEYVWTMTCVQKAVQNEVKSVDAWTYHAVITGDYNGEGTPYYEYRQASEQDWTRFDDVTVNGVSVTSDITGLQADTEYLVRLVSGDVYGAEMSFRTDSPVQIPGMGFDSWYYGGSNGKTWFPYAEGDTDPCWDTANSGVSSLIDNTTVPEYEHKVEGDAAAKMVSSFAVVKFAAGNIFSGKFAKFESFTAYLDWGVPFTAKPKALKGKYKYQPALVNYEENKMVTTDRYDQGQIQVILIQTETPYRVLPVSVAGGKTLNGPTYKDETKLIDLESHETIIARGSMIFGITDSDNDGKADWVEFELPLEYRDFRTPTYVIVTAASSYLGDYFTGGDGSVLCVDDFEFIYE